jgi:hypothetical protein
MAERQGHREKPGKVEKIYRRRGLHRDAAAGLQKPAAIKRCVCALGKAGRATTYKAFYLIANIILNNNPSIRKNLGFFPSRLERAIT